MAQILAWGLSSPDGTPQNKFEEYHTIFIKRSIYDKYLNAQIRHYSSGRVMYHRKWYNIPQNVFNDNNNWNASGFRYSYRGARKCAQNLIATAAAGRSIFWRVQKESKYEKISFFIKPGAFFINYFWLFSGKSASKIACYKGN